VSALVLFTAPSSEPLTLTEAKAHLRVTTADEDTLITSLVVAARRHVETLTRRALVSQVWDYFLDAFPGWEIEVPLPPLVSVDSIKYLESAAGAQTTLATSEYRADAKHQPGRITPGFGKSWPATYGVTNAVEIRFTAGYGAAAAVPQGIKQAMFLLLSAWFEHREEIVSGVSVASLPSPVNVGSLLRPFVIDYFGG
jgi:uncharacterized phiE125 gp8 family phage protein